jgi:hypothetical protein
MKNNIEAFNLGFIAEMDDSPKVKVLLVQLTETCEKYPDAKFSVFFMAGKKEALKMKEQEKSQSRLSELDQIQNSNDKDLEVER